MYLMCNGHLYILDWFYLLHCLSSWVVLCHGRPLNSNGNLCYWKVLGRFSNSLFQLPCRVLRGNNWEIILHGMYCGVVLRHDYPNCSDGELCCWEVFGRIGNCLLKLPGRVLCSDGWDIILH